MAGGIAKSGFGHVMNEGRRLDVDRANHPRSGDRFWKVLLISLRGKAEANCRLHREAYGPAESQTFQIIDVLDGDK